MDLYHQILQIYPALTLADFSPDIGTIALQDDGEGPYIKSWTNTLYAQPTAAQLAAIT